MMSDRVMQVRQLVVGHPGALPQLAERCEGIARLLAAGGSCRTAAKLYGITPSRVQQLVGFKILPQLQAHAAACPGSCATHTADPARELRIAAIMSQRRDTRPNVRSKAGFEQRLARFTELRDSGQDCWDAAREVGIDPGSTGKRYEHWYQARRGGQDDPRPRRQDWDEHPWLRPSGPRTRWPQ